jgi:hypothetical protein
VLRHWRTTHVLKRLIRQSSPAITGHRRAGVGDAPFASRARILHGRRGSQSQRGVNPTSLSLAIVLFLFASCANDPTVTQEFSHKMGTLQELRDKVESRVQTLKGDCVQGALIVEACDAVRTYYTDKVMAKVNSWIAEVQGDITGNNSLAGLDAYDADFDLATQSGAGYVVWADKLHAVRFRTPTVSGAPPATVTGGGAQGGPGLEDITKVGIQVGEAVWHEYEAGQKAGADAIGGHMDKVRFRSYSEIS